MCLLGYAGFLRFDELVNIRRSDIFMQEMQIKLYISKGKTDQLKSGSWVVIAKTNKETCPVKYLQMYLSVFNIHENSDEFIFQKASYIKKLDSYTLRKGDHFSYTRVRKKFLEKLGKIGLNTSKLGLHSLRSGGATQATNSGVCDRLFKKHGRWKSESAKDRYVKENDSIRRFIKTWHLVLFIESRSF